MTVGWPTSKNHVVDHAVLGDDLMRELLHYPGETGESEGAVETLKRLLAELEGYRIAVAALKDMRNIQLAQDNSEPYMRGITNGVILSLQQMIGKDLPLAAPMPDRISVTAGIGELRGKSRTVEEEEKLLQLTEWLAEYELADKDLLTIVEHTDGYELAGGEWVLYPDEPEVLASLANEAVSDAGDGITADYLSRLPERIRALLMRS